MFNLQSIVRNNIQALLPYSSARDEFKGTSGVFLDANENPFGTLNRYPDPYQTDLKSKIASLKNVRSEQIFIGNGSDEVIDLAFRIFCQPREDKALTFSPTYGMYDVSAAINEVSLTKIPLTDSFQIDSDAVLPLLKDSFLKIIFICSPNNPTGNTLSKNAIETILKNFNGIVIIDEAYIDFSPSESWLRKLNDYPNLMVCQTFSKAWGLAAARVGMAFASEEIIRLLNKVKPPYNVSELNQKAALEAVSNTAQFQKNLEQIKTQKEALQTALQELKLVVKVYPSEANFLLVEVINATKIYSDLVTQKIITRNRNSLVANCIRISVGTPSENKKLLTALKNIES
ncbi:histidinol-phosphate transaminase [Ulvibacter litoralis]|uniref:Histidinol-phosphate aminotransferase n=1 Tax=Ulvibacter litoralis TaxID=227084 RepID=A0A1G7BW46_9FLAO|nr:histidinol-phosphate transaminase [Ulvibacter litoralis]GHC49550.1 histidinol-phosphate aminotransferase [Ulvibacter litoralis]SDE31249.1 histidinol-phosphate aminotransferase [Ulvibacter litoralis]